VNITADTGNVTVAASAAIQATVQAGQVAEIDGGSDINAQTVAGDTGVNLTAMGQISGNASSSAGDVNATSVASMNLNVNQANNVNLTSLNNLSGNINGSQQVNLTTWGSATGLSVSGNQGVSLLVIGIGSGSITSSAGTIQITAAGPAAFSGLQAGGDIDVTALGTLNLVNATAGGAVNIIAGDTISGIISAGTDATVQSLNIMGAQVTAGGNATIDAVTAIAGNVTAAGDLSAVSYGDINAGSSESLHAANDITKVWARGNIGGSIAAGSLIATITSYDAINATISTAGPIGYISAWGPISGSVTGASSASGIDSAGAVTASVSPNVNVTSHDHQLLVNQTYPADPNTSLAPVRASINDGLNQVTAFEQSLVAQQLASTLQQSALQAQAQLQLWQLQSDVATQLQDAQTSVWQTSIETEQTLTSAQADDQSSLTQTQDAIQQSTAGLVGQMAEQQQLAQAALQQVITEVAADQTRLLTIKANQQVDMAQMSAQETKNQAAAGTQLTELQAQRPAQYQEIADQMFDTLGKQILLNNAEARAYIHAALNAISMTGNFLGPIGVIVGRSADVLNAGLYYLEGDNLSAIASGISALPLVGEVLSDSADAARLTEGLGSAGADVAAADEALTEGEAAANEVDNLAENAGEEIGDGCNGLDCFVAGTEVITGYNAQTGVYSETPIQNIQVGDEVESRNQYDPNAPMELETVTAIEQNVAYDLREITIRGSDGSTETIQATDEHPFYVENQGWTGAQDLTAGEQLQEPDGSIATVVSNSDDPQANGVTVYNFTVANDHTYFVNDGGESVWVHNTCLHHIATDKSTEFTPAFEELFDRVGLDLQDEDNLVKVVGHRGPHPDIYHAIVYSRLTDSIEGLSGDAATEAFERKLDELAAECQTPGTDLNFLITHNLPRDFTF
jgi:hypothetical protein